MGTMPLILAGMLSMEVIQLKVQGRKLHYGSLRVLLLGKAASTSGSMSEAYDLLQQCYGYFDPLLLNLCSLVFSFEIIYIYSSLINFVRYLCW
ncbi:hypothetical protein QN277_026214 [Acacia crassicarpa]|uniref:Uncharacterized protein n=1 Tax=Acacia crassicarpa TaxID=499986 RepID=A0AAE1JBN2_9FABA|nr:hypothetical protein QN277_026214 [Acacia crassicarpa]